MKSGTFLVDKPRGSEAKKHEMDSENIYLERHASDIQYSGFSVYICIVLRMFL